MKLNKAEYLAKSYTSVMQYCATNFENAMIRKNSQKEAKMQNILSARVIIITFFTMTSLPIYVTAQSGFYLQRVDEGYSLIYHGTRHIGMANYIARDLSPNPNRVPRWQFFASEMGKDYAGIWYLDDNTVVVGRNVLGVAENLNSALRLLVSEWYGSPSEYESRGTERGDIQYRKITIQVTDDNGFEIPDAYGIVTWYSSSNAQGYSASDEFRAVSNGTAQLTLRPYPLLSISVWSRSERYLPFQTERMQAYERVYTIRMRRLW